MSGKISKFTVHGGFGEVGSSLTGVDVRYPTNVTGDGTDAMNKECDYSAAYIDVETDTGLHAQGMTFSEFVVLIAFACMC